MLRGEGGQSLLPLGSQGTYLSHQSLLHCTLSPAIHFNGSNGTAYNRASNAPKQVACECGVREEREMIFRGEAVERAPGIANALLLYFSKH